MTTQTLLDRVRSIHARAATKWRRAVLAQRPVVRGFVDSACQARRLLVLAPSCALLIASPAWSEIILSNDTTSLRVNGGEANNGLLDEDGYFRYTNLATSEETTWSVDPMLVFSDGSIAVLSDGLFGSPVDIGGGIVRSTAMTNGVIVQADTRLIGGIARTEFNFSGLLDNITFVFYTENDILIPGNEALFTGSIAGGDLELVQYAGGLSVLLSGEAGFGATLSLFGSGIFMGFGKALESGDLSVLSSDGSNFVGGPADLGLALAFSLAGSEATVIVDYLVVPEPSACILLTSAIAGAACRRRKRR